jgi:2-polyprenyl-3-methyl-5-hydroxy-6-metoxy-1,4-benzoquinol methylase
MTASANECPVCGHTTEAAGRKFSQRLKRDFVLLHCPSCRLTFVSNPWTDYPAIYNEAYYQGRGADPFVDYVTEMKEPERTVRAYEWSGIQKVVGSLVPVNERTRWLDFGCGNGMLVEHLRGAGLQAFGFEEGWIAAEAIRRGISVLSATQLESRAGSFDVATAIEVLEHVTDPIGTLARIRNLLRAGGLFFYTTGNARPHRGRIAAWRYCIPEIHVSFFEPETLQHALDKTGFRTEYRGYLPGYDEIIRFKVLKNLHIRHRNGLERLVPWKVFSPALEARLQLFRHPIAWAE